MENKKLISVIIPIYNCEKTITATLQSIIGQSYESLEIILVDDGSIDNSYKICNNYAKKDSRIKLIKQINSGVGAARNKGLDNCNGDYISFIDADDTVNENFYEELIGAAVMTDADIVGCNVCVNIDDNCLYPYGNNNQKLIYIDNQIIEKYLNFEISTAVWGKLYSKGIIGNLKFEKLSINEDFIFSWELIKKSKIFFQNNNTNYNYYANTPNSLTKEKFNCNNMSLVTHADNVMKDITCISEKLLEAGENYYYACVLHNFILYYNQKFILK